MGDSDMDERESLKNIVERWDLAPAAHEWTTILEALSAQVLAMLTQDRRRLLNTLYRLDVSELKVREALASGQDSVAQSRRLAELILAREMQKARTRAQGS